jgi:hypothetical protein
MKMPKKKEEHREKLTFMVEIETSRDVVETAGKLDNLLNAAFEEYVHVDRLDVDAIKKNMGYTIDALRKARDVANKLTVAASDAETDLDEAIDLANVQLADFPCA